MKNMIHYRCVFLLIVTGILLPGCDSTDPEAADPPADTNTEDVTLLKTDQAWAAAAANGNIPQVLNTWSDDAINYFPGAAPAVGKAAIGALMQQNRSIPGFALSWEPAQAMVSTSGDLGHTRGVFRLTVNDPNGTPQTRIGHYVSLWQKGSDDAWKCIVTISTFGPA